MAPRRRRSRVADPAPGFRSWKRGGGQWRADEFLAGFGRLRGERRRGAPDLPEPSGEGSAGECSEAAIGGAAPGRQVASKLRSAGFTGEPQRRTASLERSGSRQGQGQVPSGAWSNTAADAPLGGAKTGPTRVGRARLPRQCSSRISLGTLFFAFRVLVPFFLRRRPDSDRWISREEFGVYYGLSKLRGMTV